ncbi:MAG: hypothetical protein HC786_13435 [Richelia sp. CSU_2_1]|nr:hypothetical protein [Richelia sp. CSU_2_1]
MLRSLFDYHLEPYRLLRKVQDLSNYALICAIALVLHSPAQVKLTIALSKVIAIVKRQLYSHLQLNQKLFGAIAIFWY